MDILTDKYTQVFDLEAVRKGDLVRAKYKSWPEPHNGIIARATEKKLQVLYIPGATNVSNYFTICAEEVAAGDWAILWSHDLELIQGELPADCKDLEDLDEVDDEL